MRPATVPRGLWWGISRARRADILRDLAGLRWGQIYVSSGTLMVSPWGCQFIEVQ